MALILLLDDDDGFRASLAETLTDLGHAVRAEATLAGARAALADTPQLALIDLRLGAENGLDFVRHARTVHPDLPCVVLTAYASGDNTIEAMKLGAFDHLTKPIGRAQLADVVAAALARTPADALPDDAAAEPGLIGTSPAMREVQKRIGLAAASDTTVLIGGETGTGKEVVARLLHRHSARANGPFVAVNCAAIPADLIESELFGHVRGAFSGAHADRAGRFREAGGGTLLLDEVGDMPLALQAKLLRVLQEREVVPVGAGRAYPVDVRVIAASHRALADEARAGRFREDLYYRLDVFPIHLPPLRERAADLPTLAAHFLRPYGKRPAQAALDRLARHAWPGNVRELRNVLERAALTARGSTIGPDDLALGGGSGGDEAVPWDAPLTEAVAWLETRMIRRALDRAGGNVSEAARALGISRQQLYRKLAD
ncbi:sigma-54-dependent Fis family transcriptional regulator [Betaproteobacteria bacterium SCN1]|jgi:DNA-binding NtrC family response regulator|nr:sigma-54-dependent Fis family transcriptional regulator [Betaproteobacteria bacterium SCN1]